MSTHQFPFYPGTGAAAEVGAGEGEGFTVNAPLAAGATDGDYAAVFDRVFLPVLDRFRPQLLLVSAGFDAHMRDPLAAMRVSVAGFDLLASRLRAFAAAHHCPAVFITEGGYHLKALGACLFGLVRTLLGRTADEPGDSPVPPSVRDGSAQAEPRRADDAPLVEHPTTEATSRGAATVDLVRDAQKRYWPGL